MQNKELILFDLDGVLIDSKENMKLAWNAVQTLMNINTPFESYFNLIGMPFKDIMYKLKLSDYTDEIEIIFNNVSSRHIDNVPFYPNVETVLSQLCKTYQLGIVTSKDRERTELILSKLDNKFEVISTPNGALRGKPAPDHLLHAMAIRNVDPSETLYIGDMLVDKVAAERARIDYIHASWGYAPHMAGTSKSIPSIDKLINVLQGDL